MILYQKYSGVCNFTSKWECESWIVLLAKINSLPNGDSVMVQTVVASGRMCCGGLTLMFGYRRTCLLFLRYWLWNQGLRPASISFYVHAARKFLSIRGFLQQSFGAVQALIAQTVIYSSPWNRNTEVRFILEIKVGAIAQRGEKRAVINIRKTTVLTSTWVTRVS